ncbi:UNKNOWN [Stylonychia lemnae]|uniref:Uncharacterized protein n=1 Tax=Stylonychia lemnae TaxID=5949 RepID=A0A078AIG7_STYLE|nr:UNKNOWN [Stylonychia lemnae]|eukprot:CDW81292.1 UNKNOWN [Stylonychia lemnae]
MIQGVQQKVAIDTFKSRSNKRRELRDTSRTSGYSPPATFIQNQRTGQKRRTAQNYKGIERESSLFRSDIIRENMPSDKVLRKIQIVNKKRKKQTLEMSLDGIFENSLDEQVGKSNLKFSNTLNKQHVDGKEEDIEPLTPLSQGILEDNNDLEASNGTLKTSNLSEDTSIKAGDSIKSNDVLDRIWHWLQLIQRQTASINKNSKRIQI